jgi:hypothetical protein
VVRIVHDYRQPDGSVDVKAVALGIACASMPGLRASSALGDAEIWLRARDEGAWGNRLKARLTFRTRALAIPATAFTSGGFLFERGVDIVAGAVLRLDHGLGLRTVARVARVWEEWDPDRALLRCHAAFDAPAPLPPLGAELVEGDLAVEDGIGRVERHERLGLASSHRRWLARVLVEESALLYPGDNIDLPQGDPRRTWYGRDLVIDPDLPAYQSNTFASPERVPSEPDFRPVEERFRDIVPADFFDPDWVSGNECAGAGVHALVELPDLSLVAVPDLYSPGPLAPVESVLDEGGAGADFCQCLEPVAGTQAPRPDDLDGLRLDPGGDLATIVALQRRLLDLADALQSFIVLLDVPPGLSQRAMLRWRGQCHSMYAAAYHPWLLVARADDQRDVSVRVPPSAIAAGIIARRERAFGVQYGPANELAAGVFDVVDRVTPVRHDELHQLAINVYLRERDGVRLSAGRTLSPDAGYRQLSVRRLMTMLRRVLDQQMQWVVFEPNTPQLRGDIRNQLDAFLRQLYAANAFAGARAEEAFFVRCDDELNTPAVVDQGRLLAYIGVAPAEPLEFLVLQIARDGDGTLRIRD